MLFPVLDLVPLFLVSLGQLFSERAWSSWLFDRSPLGPFLSFMRLVLCSRAIVIIPVSFDCIRSHHLSDVMCREWSCHIL